MAEVLDLKEDGSPKSKIPEDNYLTIPSVLRGKIWRE